jgi:predicted nucleic acid-binding protein
LNRYTVDASVVVKWLLPEPGSEAAVTLRTAERLYAPELLFAETANVLRQRTAGGSIPEEKAQAILSILLKAPMEIFPLRPLMPDALKIACRARISVYDAIYVATAWAAEAPLVTADRQLHGRISALPGKRPTVIHLEDLLEQHGQ